MQLRQATSYFTVSLTAAQAGVKFASLITHLLSSLIRFPFTASGKVTDRRIKCQAIQAKHFVLFFNGVSALTFDPPFALGA